MAFDLWVLDSKLTGIDVELSVSTLVISDINHFAGMKGFWDRELKDHVDDPFFFSCLLVEYWKLGQSFGWHPFLFVFLSGGSIVGFALLKMRSRFGFRYVTNIDPYMCPVFFSDDYREVCIEKMISFLFRQLNCESADITFEDESANQRILEKVCRKKDFNYTRIPSEGKAIIPVKTSLESFQSSLGSSRRKKFRKIAEKFARLKTWKIYGVKLDSSSIKRIWEVEKYSWKRNLTGKAKVLKNLDLAHIIRAAEKESKSGGFFESEVWFLDLNDVPIAYILVLKCNRTAFFAKTSFDSRFRNLVPGIFLMNDLVERVFREKAAEKIDFISNLPFVRVWKPLVKKRITFEILRNVLLSKTRRLVFENRISLKSLQILERARWEKRAR